MRSLRCWSLESIGSKASVKPARYGFELAVIDSDEGASNLNSDSRSSLSTSSHSLSNAFETHVRLNHQHARAEASNTIMQLKMSFVIRRTVSTLVPPKVVIRSGFFRFCQANFGCLDREPRGEPNLRTVNPHIALVWSRTNTKWQLLHRETLPISQWKETGREKVSDKRI